MRLVDLEPRWFAEPGRHGPGLTFNCPCCLGTPRATRLGVAFKPTLDGGPLVSLHIRDLVDILWPHGPIANDVVPPGIHWDRLGDTFDGLALSPPINATAAGHWPDWIPNGDMASGLGRF